MAKRPPRNTGSMNEKHTPKVPAKVTAKSTRVAKPIRKAINPPPVEAFK